MKPSGDRRETHSICIEKERLKFSAAHFTLFPGGKAERLHGHNYQVKIEVGGPLDAFGMVADFAAIKKAADAVRRELDEKTLLPGLAPSLTIREGKGSVEVRRGASRYVFPAEDVEVLPIVNSTAECLAAYFAGRMEKTLKKAFGKNAWEFLRVSISESPGQYGVFEARRERNGGEGIKESNTKVKKK